MQIRDKRDRGWFWLDSEYLKKHAKHLGVYCTVVYLSLCKYADNETQSCFPSMKLISEENGINIRTVVRCTKKLEEFGIVSINRAKKQDGTQENNVYTLLSTKCWNKKPSDSQSIGANECQISTKPSDSDDQSRVTPVPYNYTHNNYTMGITKQSFVQSPPILPDVQEITPVIKDNKSENINEIIKLFEVINSNCKKMYGNKTQRNACEELIESYTFERVSFVIENTLPKTNRIKFFPAITSPLQLVNKWSLLEIAVKKYRDEKNIKNNKYKVAF